MRIGGNSWWKRISRRKPNDNTTECLREPILVLRWEAVRESTADCALMKCHWLCQLQSDLELWNILTQGELEARFQRIEVRISMGIDAVILGYPAQNFVFGERDHLGRAVCFCSMYVTTGLKSEVNRWCQYRKTFPLHLRSWWATNFFGRIKQCQYEKNCECFPRC